MALSKGYISTSLDYFMSEEEYEAYEIFMKATFFCILCEVPHDRIDGWIHSRCQMEDGLYYEV